MTLPTTLQWPAQPAVHIAETSDLGQHGRSAQYQYIADLMRKYQGNRSKIADLLGITPRALRYRLASMRKHGIEVFS
ncbi:lateral flagellar RpoN-interacting regulatory protein [Escherichia coli]|nr:lateral flagellar RpoN-interacting regulatory protein [Escherichia coli]